MTKALLATALIACSSSAKPVTTTPAPAPLPPSQPAASVSDIPEAPPVAKAPEEDPYLWLEDVTGEKALAWAREQNKRSTAELEQAPTFGPLRDRIRAILDSKEKIPFVQKRGSFYYNFWRDAQNTKGLLRRTSLAEYKKKEPKWETVLDVDALAKAENENWVYAGITCLYPKYDRCVVMMSHGGGDTHVTREFDMATKQFV